MKEWFEKLTKRELIHVLESTRSDLILDGLKRNIATGDCLECRAIGRKLGVDEANKPIKRELIA